MSPKRAAGNPFINTVGAPGPVIIPALLTKSVTRAAGFPIDWFQYFGIYF
jgi:hypothetical protein